MVLIKGLNSVKNHPVMTDEESKKISDDQAKKILEKMRKEKEKADAKKAKEAQANKLPIHNVNHRSNQTKDSMLKSFLENTPKTKEEARKMLLELTKQRSRIPPNMYQKLHSKYYNLMYPNSKGN
jgi:hypothetical protein